MERLPGDEILFPRLHNISWSEVMKEHMGSQEGQGERG